MALSIFGGPLKVLKRFIPKHLGDSWNNRERFSNVGSAFLRDFLFPEEEKIINSRGTSPSPELFILAKKDTNKSGATVPLIIGAA